VGESIGEAGWWGVPLSLVGESIGGAGWWGVPDLRFRRGDAL